MNKISNRLKTISNMINKNAYILDVGCDHGLLDIYLFNNNRYVKKIIASDININALNNAKENIQKYNLSNKIDLRLGSGLSVLEEKDKIDTVIIAGMGTNTIIDIIENSPFKKLNYIIQSNTKIYELRKKMQELKYKIVDEEIIKENNKYYIIIKYTPGITKYSDKELYFGPILLLKNEDIFIEYNQNRFKKLNNILKELPIDKQKEIKLEIDLYKN